MKDKHNNKRRSVYETLQLLWERLKLGTIQGSAHTISYQRWWRERQKSIADKMATTQAEEPTDPVHIARRAKYPIKFLPNVKSFSIKLKKYDWLLSLFGILRNDKADLKFEPWKNGRINRYVAWQFIRLNKCRNNPNKFWRIAWVLMSSISYNVLSFNHVCKGWHRSLPYWKVLKIVEESRWLAKQKAYELQYWRTYIPKANKGKRPLGVPSPAWRCYLHMHASILIMWLKDHISESQHAYQTGQGVLTAWKELVSVLIDPDIKDIYEFDLKGFFDGVRTDTLGKLLKYRTKMPDFESRFYECLNSSKPVISQVEMIEPTIVRDHLVGILSRTRFWDPRLTALAHTAQGPSILEKTLKTRALDPRFLKEVQTALIPFMSDMRKMHHVNGWPWEDKWYWTTVNKMIKERNFFEYWRGVPQGAPTSPILSIFALDIFMRANSVKCILYADDGIIFGNNLPTNPFPEGGGKYGIFQNLEKSHWIKRNGVWLRPVKFLGLEYDPFTEIFRAETRNGSTLEFNEWKQALIALDSHTTKILWKYPETRMPSLEEFIKGLELNLPTWEDLFKSRFYGLIISRLYTGDWNAEIKQNFELTSEKWSWVQAKASRVMRKYALKNLSVFNSSSFACHCLLTDLRRRDKKLQKRIANYRATLA